MAKAPAAGKARTKSKDTDGAPPAPAAATAPAAVAAGVESASSMAGSDPVGDDAAIGGADGEAGKGDGAAAGTAPDPGIEQECLVVTGPERGRRRCGVRFGSEPEVIPLAWLRPGEVEAIEADPELTVVRELRVVRPL
jgi:hypothetical protein